MGVGETRDQQESDKFTRVEVGKTAVNVALINGVQTPLPTNGDSVYEKDIDITNSDIGGFTGSIEDLFNDYNTEIVDSSATNPKIFKIRFYRPVSSNAFGLGSKTGDFSNVKILLKDLSGTVRVILDDSANNTKYTSNVYAFVHSEFIEAEIQFHTADPVTLNGSFIPKQKHVVAVISGINDVSGLAEQVKVDNGELIVGGKIGLKNTSNNNINPATEDKQDAIISALGGSSIYDLLLDDTTTANVTYVGEATIGSITSANVWRIKKINETTGLTLGWAGSVATFSQIWDDRASLSYSQ